MDAANIKTTIKKMEVAENVRTNLVKLWGEPSRTADFKVSYAELEIYKWDEKSHPEEVTFYSTIGMSSYPLKGFEETHRIELFIGFSPEKDEIAVRMASLAFTPILQQIAIDNNHTMTFPDPLWEGTEMQTLLITIPDVEIIPTLINDNEIHVQFMQIIPLFPSELEFKKRFGVDLMFEKWEKEEVPFWDPNRLPAF